MIAIREPLVHVVVLNYRSSALTIDCVRSLAGLSYRRCQVTVVDNASGGDELARLRSALPDVTVLSALHNGGYTAGNNLGLEHAIGSGADYCLVLNPDTVVTHPGFLGELVDFLERNRDVGCVGPRVMLREPGRVQNTVLRFPWPWRRVLDGLWIALGGSCLRSGDVQRDALVLNGVCVLFRSDCLRDVGLFDPRYFAYVEDVDWSWRARAKGWRRVYRPVESILHLQPTQGYGVASRVDILLKRNTLYFLLKSGHMAQAAIYSLAIGFLGAWRTLAAAPADRARHAQAWRTWLRSAAMLWTGRWDQALGPLDRSPTDRDTPFRELAAMPGGPG